MMALRWSDVAPDARRGVLQFLAFQAAWFACVAGAARGEALLGTGAVAAVVLLHLATSRGPARDGLLLLIALLTGALWDSLLAAGGLVVYASPGPLPAFAPGWILALWALFATLLAEPLRWLHARPFVACIAGAVGGPLSYAAAARMQACSFPQPALALAVLAAGWGLLTPALLECARRLEGAHAA